MKKYNLLVCGGTFDRLHRGHRDFLSFVLNLGEKIVIGLTSDAYIQQFKNGLGIEPFELRLKNLGKYLETIQAKDRVEVISIDDHFGPTVGDAYPFDCLAVTESTEEMGRLINVKRQERALPLYPLEIFQLTRSDDGKPITSTRIRHGEIDREGKPYVNPALLGKKLLLPSTLRSTLQDEWGEIIEKTPLNLNSSKIITVGDATTGQFLDLQIQPFIAIIDNKVERKNSDLKLDFSQNTKKIQIINPARTIMPKVFIEMGRLFSQKAFDKVVIEVEGEEDLLFLPALLYAPLGFEIFYGQRGQGLVRVGVTEEVKQKAREIINLFETS